MLIHLLLDWGQMSHLLQLDCFSCSCFASLCRVLSRRAKEEIAKWEKLRGYIRKMRCSSCLTHSKCLASIHPSIHPPSITLTRKHWVAKKLLYVAAELIEKLKWQFIIKVLPTHENDPRGSAWRCVLWRPKGERKKKEKSKEKPILMMSQLQMQPNNLV